MGHPVIAVPPQELSGPWQGFNPGGVQQEGTHGTQNLRGKAAFAGYVLAIGNSG